MVGDRSVNLPAGRKEAHLFLQQLAHPGARLKLLGLPQEEIPSPKDKVAITRGQISV